MSKTLRVLRLFAFQVLCLIAVPAGAQSIRVTYVGNAGFLVQMGGKKILVDGCFRGFPGAYQLPQEVQDKLAGAQEPFDGIDLILATHAHGDHFDPALVRALLRRSPKTVFASTFQATKQLMDLPEQIVCLEATRGKPDQKVIAGIQVEAMYFPHGAPVPGRAEISNFGYLVSAGGHRFLHTGDFDPSQISYKAFRALRIPERKLDLAFIQHYCLGEEIADQRLVREGIGARFVFPSHYHLTEPPLQRALVLRNYPAAILFGRELDAWVTPEPGGKGRGASPSGAFRANHALGVGEVQ